ncbi:MAG: Transcriptional regulatory protein CusR [Phycisphaerae bacterium]|nr:Transcriptional regulatory protein CusR [Phycisphaerae bacterium]
MMTLQPLGDAGTTDHAMRILLIEDNPKMTAFIRQGLAEHGYAVDVAMTATEGETIATSQDYAAIILDIMLPEGDGVEVCRRLRHGGRATPVLLLTALSTTADKVRGLDAGADDYLTKPFEFEELLARIRALLRRGQAQEASFLRFHDLQMDLLSRVVKRDNRTIRLTSREFALLEVFMRNPNRVLSRTMIGQQVWEMDFVSDSNVIDVYVSMLRRKIDRDFPDKLIHTIIGAGYMLSPSEPAP